MNDDGIFIHDNARLLLILRNLIGNAFKFGKAQERNHVVLTVGRRGRALTLEVSDQGLGLGSEQISRLFDDQTFQNDASDLGLAMVRMLLRLMHSEMKISSEPGVGSKFTVVIPEQSEVHLENTAREYLPLAGLLILFARITALASTHMHLMEQSQKSRLLMDGILEFHQRRGPQKLCQLDQTLAKTANLMGPRLRLACVRLTMDLPPQNLMIHAADLMQVGISLITILCHRLEMLLDQDKWLNITADVLEELVLIRLSCGGPKLTEAQALRLFDPVAEGAEGIGHSGLHVARRIVLRTPGRLDFNVSGNATCFQLELPKASPGI